MSIFSSRRYRNQLPHSLSSPKRKWSPVSQASVRLHAGPSGEQHNLLQRGQAFLSKTLTSFISAVYVLSLTSFSQENILLAFQLSQQRRQTSSLSRRGHSINASWTLWEFFTLTTCEQGRVVAKGPRTYRDESTQMFGSRCKENMSPCLCHEYERLNRTRIHLIN